VKTFLKTTVVLLAFSAVFAVRLQAQTAGRILVAATLYVAVDDWGDFYLNGIPISEQPYTSPDKSYRVVKCIPEHLCYFKRDNVLAIQVEKSGKQMAQGQDSVGVAYVLRMKFSDGTEAVISSNEAEKHDCLFLSDRMMERPSNWMGMKFNDARWGKALNTGFNVPFITPLNDPQTGQPAGFLSALSASPKAQYPGERHFFRRNFHVDIDPNPDCLKPTVKKSRKPEGPRHVFVPPAPPTPTPMPVYSGVYPALPTPMKPYLPPSATPSPTPMPTFTFTPVVVLEEQAVPNFNPTPTLIIWARTTMEPLARRMKEPILMPMPSPTLVPTYTPVPVVPESQPLTFSRSSGNIYISFADGSGNYRLEVLNSEGRHVKTLFDKRVIAQQGEWAEWDGKDENGKDAPPGSYTVVLSKADVVLKNIYMLKTKEGL
jgi:hypothetical protein